MKKTLLSLLVCSLLLASCSKYEEPSADPSMNDYYASSGADSSNISTETSDGTSDDSSEDNNMMFDFSLLSEEELAQYITLGKYKGFESEKVVVEITDKDVEKAIKNILQMYGEWKEVTDAPIKKEDRVTMDYKGFLNGETFEGGTATDQTIVIGEGKYIEGFEDGLIGVKSGEKISLDLTFPENYGDENLKGKAVVFEITVKKVEEYIIPELTEKIVKDYTKEEITTVEDFLKKIKEDLYEDALYEKTYTSVSEYWKKAIDNATVIKYPDGIIDEYVQSYLDYYEQYATLYGCTVEELLGKSLDEFKKECSKAAEEMYKDRMVFQAAMYAEKFDSNIDETKYNEWLEDQAEMMGINLEMLLSQYNVETLEYAYLYETFRNHLYESRIEIEPSESENSTETSAEE